MEELVEALRARNIILFVGSGVSSSLGLPSFAGLITEMAKELGYDADIFATYGPFPVLAEYYAITRGSLDPLRSRMDLDWHGEGRLVENSTVHRLIVDLGFPIVYTTNYDRWLEKAFDHYGKRYVKIAQLGDLIKVRDGLTQIVKFHGDFDDDSSIVLTESSYHARLNFESFLDLKLQADSLARTILFIFIGYSLTDINIRYLLFRLQRLWECSGYIAKRPKSYLYLDKPNAVQQQVWRARGVETIVSTRDDAGEGLKLFLEDLGRKTAA